MDSFKQDSVVCRDLRLPLAVMVVFIHSFGYPADVVIPDITGGNLSNIDIYNLIRVLFSRVLTHISVPCFFVISGYYFFYDVSKKGEIKVSYFRNKWKKRFWSLLVPYVTWNIVYILWMLGYRAVYSLVGTSEGGVNSVLEELSEKGILSIFWNYHEWPESYTNIFGDVISYSSPILMPFWFIRDLIVVVLCTPIIYLAVKKHTKATISILMLLYILGIETSVPGLSLESLFFFSLGAAFSINGQSITEFVSKPRIRNISYVIALATLFLSVINYGKENYITCFYYRMYCIFGIISLFNIMLLSTLLVSKLKFAKFSDATFFIYALHNFIGLFIARKILDIVIPGISAYLEAHNSLSVALTSQQLLMAIAYYLTLPFLASAVCVALYMLTKRILPSPLFGLLNRGK